MADAPTIRTHTATDGYQWHYRRLEPATGRARAEVICLHGIQSHGGWYGNLCAALADAGFGVSFLDRRGCGLNRAARGDAPSFRRLLDDVAEYARTRPEPRVLVAISWAGKLAVGLPYRHPGLFAGTALVTPGLRPKVGVPFGDRLAIAWARLVSPTRPFPIPLSEAHLFTADPLRQAFITADPLALHAATARLLAESTRLDVQLRWSKRALTGPVLALLAGRDRIVDTPATRRYLATLRASVDVVEYPAAEHTLEFEPTPGAYHAALTDWIDRKVLAPARGAG